MAQNISDEIKALYKKTNDSTVVKDYIITIGNEVLNNEKIVFGSFKLQEELCSSEQLTFGECNAAQLQFQCAAEIGDIKSMPLTIVQVIGKQETSIKTPIYTITEPPTLDNYPANTFYKDIYYPYEPEDERVLCPGDWTWEFDADAYKQHAGSIAYNEGTENYYVFEFKNEEFVWQELNVIKLGVFNVDSCVLTANKRYRDVIAYDNIYLFRRDVSSWYNSLKFPITVNQMLSSLCSHIGVEFENTELVNGEVMLDKTIEPDELLGSTILESIAEINGGFFRADTDGKLEFVTIDSKVSDKLQVKNYSSLKIEDFTTQKYTRLNIRSEEGDIGVSTGSGDNAYIIEDNMLLYGKSTDELKPIAERLYSIINDVYYTPFTAVQAGLPYIKPGNRIEYELVSGKYFTGLILQRTLTGTQVLKDSIKTTGTEKTEAVYGIEKEIIKLKGKSNVLSRTIEETKSTITNVEEGLTSELHQTASGLEAKIEQVAKENGGEMPIYTVTETPTMDNYPADTFFKDIYYPYEPEDERVLYPGDWTWEFDNDSYKEHIGSVAYNEVTGECYKFEFEGGEFRWRKLEESELTYILNSLTSLNLETGKITLEVQETRKNIENNYYTKVEADSKITQTASSIKQEVSATYATQDTVKEVSGNLELKVDKNDNDQVVSMLNASADEIYLKSNRFRLESSNTNIDTNGVIETKKISVTGGNITLDGSMNTENAISSQVSVIGNKDDSEIRMYSYSSTSYLRALKGKYYSTIYPNQISLSISEKSGNATKLIDRFILSAGNATTDFDGSGYMYLDGSIHCKSAVIQGDNLNISASGNITTSGSITASGGIKNNSTDFSYTKGSFTVGGNAGNASNRFWVDGGAYVNGNLGCSGTKNRVVNTKNYGKVFLNAYETASPMFGDIGTGQLDDNGECIIFLDDVFIETIDNTSEYVVFLQKYGQGELWVDKIEYNYFAVKGTVENLKFAWEVKAKQKDYVMYRLENETSNNFGVEYMDNDSISDNRYEVIEFENEEAYENAEFEDVTNYEVVEFEYTEIYEL